MDKEMFCEILEAALLSFDEVPKEKIVQSYGINERLVNIGIKLCSYLKSIKLQEVKNGDKF